MTAGEYREIREKNGKEFIPFVHWCYCCDAPHAQHRPGCSCREYLDIVADEKKCERIAGIANKRIKEIGR